MALWSWRTLSDGSVEVDRADGAGFVRLGLGDHPQVLRTVERVLSWAPLAAEKSAKYGVPLAWILAVVYAESGGVPDADNAPQCGGTGCVGLMAIHWAAHGQSREDMLSPDNNLDYGTSLLARSRAKGYDLPAAASRHVAGGGAQDTVRSGTCTSAMASPDFPEGSPFGYCEHVFPRPHGDGSVGYIDKVVRSNNTFIDLLGARTADEEPYAVTSTAEAGAPPPPARLAAFVGAAAFGYLAISELSRWLRTG